jgi:hypothetical protein
MNDFLTYLSVGKTIGKGTFGKVKLGNHNLTGEKVRIHPFVSTAFNYEILLL